MVAEWLLSAGLHILHRRFRKEKKRRFREGCAGKKQTER